MYDSAAQAADSVIDLRSDTVTKPSPAMRKAMFEAEVGDDVYAEDPTINRLEQRAAEIFGREAGLFVPSGTMGNQIAAKLHTTHGQEVICEERGHVFDYEMAMMAHFSGLVARTVRAEDGIVTWAHVKSKLRPRSYHSAKTGLVWLENTHNIAGGMVTPLEVFNEICDESHALGLPVHLDGARVFNASVALGIPVDRLTAKADTVMFCLSKGLGAPVGSMLVGKADVIDQGRIYRKALGGGMRQAGILAAAGLIALEEGSAEAGNRSRQCEISRRGTGEDSRLQDRSSQGADEHHHLRHHGDWQDFWRNLVRTGGAQGASKWSRSSSAALCHAPRRQPRRVCAGAGQS